MARGVPQSFYIDEFADEGIMFEGAAGPPDYLAMSMPFSRERHRDLMLRFENLSQFGVMVSDSSRGSVRERAGRVEIRYDLNHEDAERFRRGLLRLTELYWAAGAREVFQPVDSVGTLRDGDLGPLAARPLKPRELKLMAFHPLGTARADAEPRPRRGGRRPAPARRRGPVRVRRQRGAELAGREPADHDHGAGHAAGLRPARQAGAGGRAGAGEDR